MESKPLAAAARASVAYPEPPLTGELAVALPAGARFGVCLSHDVDHLGLREHLVDGFLARYAVNVVRQNLLGRFRPLRALDAYWGLVLAGLGRDRWDVIDTLVDDEQRFGLPSTFFVAVRPGLGIAYRRDALAAVIPRLEAAGREVGLHGQSPHDAAALAAEVDDLAGLAAARPIGLRMHYLRLTSQVLDGAAKAGLRYDTTVMEREDMRPDTHPLPGPRLVRPGLFEIPLHVMDSTLFSVTGLGFDAALAQDYLRRLMDNAAARGRVIVLNLHPNAYSQQDRDARDWFRHLLGVLTSRSDAFVTDLRGLLPRIVMP